MDNRITRVEPQAFQILTSLKTVNLSNNMLAFDDISKNGNSVLSPLNYCRMLENIQLENNTLNMIFPDWLHFENLEFINLAYNNISQITVSKCLVLSLYYY